MKHNLNKKVALLLGILGAILFLGGTFVSLAQYSSTKDGTLLNYMILGGMVMLVAVPVVLKKLFWALGAFAAALVAYLWLFTDVFVR